ncbi:universal stress protein [Ohtaekwangia koreensis]|uniref:Nucleotide-binding universal stress protein, UspA family n=1 Tax=Ohtaekwangia koreensis TaxID=688867 RepID=A0A1T5M5R1_9BACT|nr:universal stress protein [Ohtaekwangia koreensis]SKC83556.1 Nucleotide-binding universal stress protein, UspA family [Ohtaekwangia koreensis]
MKNIKNILCPTDFSPAAQNAIAYAAKLAQIVQGDLTLLHVQSVFDFTPASLVSGKKILLTNAVEQLETQCTEVSRAFKISCYPEVESSASKLSTVIHEKAKNFDIIVMGTDGADDWYQFFGGSNTYNAIARSETPLLLIPSGYIFSEIKTMVYAFDYLKERHLPITHLLPIVKALNCKLTILQVIEEAYSQDVEDDLKELQYIIGNFYGEDLHFDYSTIRSNDVAQAINSYIVRNQPDSLVLCSVHRNIIQRLFHNSLIKKITAFCNYPLFVIHS